MKLIKKEDNYVELEFERNEWVVIRNSFLEICCGFELEDFETKIGANEEYAKNLYEKVKAIGVSIGFSN